MSVEKFGLKFHPNFKLLHKNFGAIMLFGHIFTRKSETELRSWLNTITGQKTANHERIHVLQAKSFKLSYFTYYICYLSYWIKNLFKFGFNMSAYYNIPFEKEAYINQLDFEYNDTHWKDYIDDL
jgi:hypothetical protein